jgi:hypothetical protein
VMPDEQVHAAIRAAALLLSFCFAGLLLAGWLYVRRREADAAADDEAAQVAQQELVRVAGISQVPDAGPVPRGQREGEGSPADEPWEAVSLELQQDRGQGEPGARQELVQAPWLDQAPQEEFDP